MPSCTEAGGSHVEELSDPYLLWFWNSNVRTTSIVLNSLVKADVADAPVRQMVRWMMAARKDGRWGNTQENALAMEALVAYYRKFEGVVAGFPRGRPAWHRGSRPRGVHRAARRHRRRRKFR